MAIGIKTGGREAGTPNRVSKELKIVLKELLDTEFETIGRKLNELSTKDRLEVLVKLLPFVLPKNQKVDQDVKFSPNLDEIRPIVISVNGIPKSILAENDHHL